MIKSMTGFGKGEARFKSGKITVEIKTVNHKFFDATLKLPNGITIFEDEIKEVLSKSLKRGKHTFQVRAKRSGIVDKTPATKKFKI